MVLVMAMAMEMESIIRIDRTTYNRHHALKYI